MRTLCVTGIKPFGLYRILSESVPHYLLSGIGLTNSNTRSNPPHTTLAQTSDYLNNMLASPTNGTLDFAVVLPPSPSLASSTSRPTCVGKLGIFSTTRSDIGYFLARPCWRQGYMFESLKAWVEYLWSEECERVSRRRVELVIADVDPRNEGSLSLLQRFGWTEFGRRERTIETHLGWCDSVDLVLWRPEEVEDLRNKGS